MSSRAAPAWSSSGFALLYQASRISGRPSPVKEAQSNPTRSNSLNGLIGKRIPYWVPRNSALQLKGDAGAIGVEEPPNRPASGPRDPEQSHRPSHERPQTLRFSPFRRSLQSYPLAYTTSTTSPIFCAKLALWNQKPRARCCNLPFRLDLRLRSSKQWGTHGRVFCVLARDG